MLDLYAGSGALGLEALSRGAISAVFVERDGDAVRAIERNLDKLRLTGTVLRRTPSPRSRRRRAPGGSTISSSSTRPTTCTLDLQPQLARYLPSVLADDGVLVVETDARVEPELPLPQRTSRKYGRRG